MRGNMASSIPGGRLFLSGGNCRSACSPLCSPSVPVLAEQLRCHVLHLLICISNSHQLRIAHPVLDLLARVVTAPPLFSAILADCALIIATLGEACLAALLARRLAVPLPNPTVAPSAKLLIRRLPRGESTGICRHWQPVFTTYSSASTIRRNAYLHGRPPPCRSPRSCFSKDLDCDHCASFKSPGYMLSREETPGSTHIPSVVPSPVSGQIPRHYLRADLSPKWASTWALKCTLNSAPQRKLSETM